MSSASYQIQLGDDVVGSDGDKLGTVADVQATYILVEKGLFFINDYYIPISAITQAGNGQVVLNVSRHQALHSGWDTVPDAGGATGRETDRFSTDVMETTDVRGPADVVDTTTTFAQGQPQVAGYEATSEDELVIPLREEELTATVRDVEAGAARIEKRVVAEDRVLEVPVTEEQIRVERRVVDRPASAIDADAFQETVIDVPLTEEQVQLQKQTRVAEEVVVSKEAIQHTEQVRGTVRREEVDVVEEGLTTETLRDGGRQA